MSSEIRTNWWKPLWLCVAVGAVASGLGGCGGDANMARVKGRVTYDGQPLTTGEVSFSSVDGGRVAMSNIDSKGNYELRTSTTVVGVPPGSYKVKILAVEQKSGMDQDGKPFPAKYLIPEKYGDVATSGLTATVEKGKPEINFDLKQE
jgi:hypothetical protein